MPKRLFESNAVISNKMARLLGSRIRPNTSRIFRRALGRTFRRSFRRRRMSSITAMAIRTGGWSRDSFRTERKFVDNSVAITLTFGSSAFGTPVLINGLVPGSDMNQRIGRKVVMKSFFVRWTFNIAATTTGGSPIRWICFYDKQTNATAAAVTDLLISNSFLAVQQLSNRDRFVVIADEITDPIYVNQHYAIMGTRYQKINLETAFNSGVAGTVADITTGSLFIMAAHNGLLGVANGAGTMNCRVRYDDA